MPRNLLTLFLIAALAVVCFPDTLHARQKEVRQDQSSRNLSSSSVPETRLVGDSRIDVRSGLIRARYAQPERHVYRRPEGFLESEAAYFGWTRDVDDLALVKDERRGKSRHLTYQQTFKGLPVSGRTVRINMDRLGRVSMVTSAFEPVNSNEDSFDIRPALDASAASRRALDELADGVGLTGTAELVVFDPAAPRLAWEMTLWPESEPAEYKVWVDAQSGEILEAYDQALSKHDHFAPDATVGRGGTDGSGYVFDPDPLFASGASYGPPYVDNNDLTSPELDAARKIVTLRDISQNDAGKWVLEGPFVRIVGQNSVGTWLYDPPAMDSPNDFFFDRADDRFEAVNAYYHIDTNQRYIQSLGFTDLQNEGVDVNPHGLSADDSKYYPDRNRIIFGSGGVDDAEDPSVVIHEYGHAVLNAAAPGLLSSPEGRALHEGFADYWQGSYYRNLVETGQAARTDWRWVFLWDSGEGQIWRGRYLDHSGIYPNDICVAITGGGGCSVHEDGRMWATTLMEVWDQLGRDVTDHLVLLSHYYLQAPVTFADAAQAVIQADFDYYGGAHAEALVTVFADRGLVQRQDYSPIIEHEPLLSIETPGVTRIVEARVQGVSAPLHAVELTWFSNSMSMQTVAMEDAGSGIYRAELSLPDTLDTFYYFISAQNTIGNTTFEPAGAPSSLHAFDVGVDDGPPTLSHLPIAAASFLSWPFEIRGTAEDKFGIKSVELVWEVKSPAGALVSNGTHTLASGNGPFVDAIPLPLSSVEDGSTISYFILATDRSAALNTTRLPESGEYSFEVSSGSILRDYTFDSGLAGLEWGGEWEIATPSYGMQASPGGGAVAATRADAAYSDQAGVSYLELPVLNLARVEQVHLRFWHFFDTEAEGRPDPSEQGAILYDGGLLQVRTSSSWEWVTLHPEDGYPGSLSSAGQTPLAGQPAFGGFSQGWRRVTAALPREDGVQVRFAFVTNQGNTAQADRYAGWLIEGLTVGSIDDVDAGAPVFANVPPELQVVATRGAVPTVEALIRDDLGIQDAWMDWILTSGSATDQGSVRMTQSPEDLSRFSAATDFLLAPVPGDELMVTLRASDVSGNEQEAGPFSITFRLFGSQEALTSVWATGNWEALSDGWMFRSQPSTLLSGLVLNPRDTEFNAQALSFVVDHEPIFGSGSAGLLEISVDNGDSWQALTPEGGYPGTARLDADNPLNERPAFINAGLRQESVFDLTPWIGEQIQVRFLATSEEEGSVNQHWRLFSAQFKAQTDDAMFEQTSRFELDAAYPNPFANRTRVTWSVKEAGPVRVEIFDTLGRLVAVLFDRHQEAGTHAMTWEADGMPSGMYLIRLSSGGQQATKTVVRVAR